MNKVLFFSLILSCALCIKLSDEQIVQKLNSLIGQEIKKDSKEANKEIDTYIQNQIPELKDADFISSTESSVSGKKYKNTYEKDGKRWIVTVLDKDEKKDREISEVEKVEQKKNDKGQTVQVKTDVKKETFQQALSSLF